MDGYYDQSYSGQGFQLPAQAQTKDSAQNGNNMMDATDQRALYGNQNYAQNANPYMPRRQNFSDSMSQQASPVDMAMGQNSMLEFDGSSARGALANFDFNPSGTSENMMMQNNMYLGGAGNEMQDAQNGQSYNNMSQYMNQNSSYADAQTQANSTQQPMSSGTRLNIPTGNSFMQSNMSMDFSEQEMSDIMNGTSSANNVMSPDQYGSNMMVTMPSPYSGSVSATPKDNAGAGNIQVVQDTNGQQQNQQSQQSQQNQQSGTNQMNMSRMSSRQPSLSAQGSVHQSAPGSVHQSVSGGSVHQAETPMRFSNPYSQNISQNLSQKMSQNMSQNISQNMSTDMQPQGQSMSETQNGYSQWPDNNKSMNDFNANNARPRHQGQYKDAYSSTGFDMLTLLMRVATRPNPEINIGAVDLSCAFVVCDATTHDFPITYCSDNFERLTGYTKHEILGRNCRFLQAPDGKVQAGLKRRYVDDQSVLYLKNMITARREAQVSLINYRKGGQPFMNLLTMIPVNSETRGTEFFVGFQVDLVEQPNSVTQKNPDGTYAINYQRGLTMPKYVFEKVENQLPNLGSGHTVTRDEVSTVLASLPSGESEMSKRIWDKILLENTDDVVFVLSLKGLFLYLSPSSKKVLEYDAGELMGTALSSICHPSDIVPVTRELKETSASAAVNIVFRIRRKSNGYMWFEGFGSLHTEQGKGRKSIVLVGRERPVYTLSRSELMQAGGIGDNEVWTKLSTSGMFLFVSSSIRNMLDRTPEDLLGTSIQALMRHDSRPDFMRILEIVRSGKRAASKHELLNQRGQVLQAFSTIYPGDASEGRKPTFVIAQTRLMKYSRPSATTQRSSQGSILKPERQDSVSGTSPMSNSAQAGNSQPPQVNSTNNTAFTSPNHFTSTFEAATTFAGQHGLQLGHQDVALASDENLFDELKTTRSTSWQFELRQMEKRNRFLAEELQQLLAARKKRKRRKGNGQLEKDCANCHTRVTPEWRRGPSGNRDLCNSCGLRWAKQQGRISPRTNSARSARSVASDVPNATPKHVQASNNTENQASIDRTLERNKIDGGATPKRPIKTSASGHVSKTAKIDAGSDVDGQQGSEQHQRKSSISVPTKIEEVDEESGSG